MQLIERLDAARRRWNVLEHPFYRRWECGEALARRVDHVRGRVPPRRRRPCRLCRSGYAARRLGARRRGARARRPLGRLRCGGRRAARPARLEGTEKCVTAWTSAADPLEALGILYAIEAGQPDVSRTKLDGLVEHYGFAPESPATSYFTLHAERDHEHAAESAGASRASSAARGRGPDRRRGGTGPRPRLWSTARRDGSGALAGRLAAAVGRRQAEDSKARAR